MLPSSLRSQFFAIRTDLKPVKDIHPMQIWRTTLLSPETSCVKARLVGPRCFVLRMLPQKSLASLAI